MYYIVNSLIFPCLNGANLSLALPGDGVPNDHSWKQVTAFDTDDGPEINDANADLNYVNQLFLVSTIISYIGNDKIKYELWTIFIFAITHHCFFLDERILIYPFFIYTTCFDPLMRQIIQFQISYISIQNITWSEETEVVMVVVLWYMYVKKCLKNV